MSYPNPKRAAGSHKPILDDWAQYIVTRESYSGTRAGSPIREAKRAWR